MHGGFKLLASPGVRVSEVDLEASADRRRQVHRDVRMRQHLIGLMSVVSVDDDRLAVSIESGDAEEWEEAS
jgi:hypothetical protein